MLKDFNLLATTFRRSESYACSELRYLLGEIGDSAPTIDRSGVSGVIAAKTALNPLEAIRKLRELLRERPYEFRYTLRIIPVEMIVRTDLSEIQLAATKLSTKIEKNETFRITVEKRFTTTSTAEIIETAAANIKRKVNLTKPDKILLIEVVGRLTGVSIVKPEEILAILKEKML